LMPTPTNSCAGTARIVAIAARNAFGSLLASVGQFGQAVAPPASCDRGQMIAEGDDEGTRTRQFLAKGGPDRLVGPPWQSHGIGHGCDIPAGSVNASSGHDRGDCPRFRYNRSCPTGEPQNISGCRAQLRGQLRFSHAPLAVRLD
jgi:hypothetical protein